MERIRVTKIPRARTVVLGFSHLQREYRLELSKDEASELGQSLLLVLQVEFPETAEGRRGEIERLLGLAGEQIKQLEYSTSESSNISGTKSEEIVRIAIERLQSAFRCVEEALRDVAGVHFPARLPRGRG